jgi:hypothetical protein
VNSRPDLMTNIGRVIAEGLLAQHPQLVQKERSRCVRRTVRFGQFEFGVIDIDGVSYAHDVVVDRGRIHRRKKKASKKFRETFGHTPLSVEENIPWKCTCLVIGTGAYGRLPVMDDVKREAEDRRVRLVVLPTAEAIKVLQKQSTETNAVLHVTC